MLLRLVTVGIVTIGAASALALGALGCGSGGGVLGPDGGAQVVARLVVLDPPGESVGLSFGARVTLQVRYELDGGSPGADTEVRFAILESTTGNPGGSTLSASTSITDDDGIAAVDLTAGAVRTNFRVEASAPNAASVYFYVAVSADDFAVLTVEPVHAGNRDPASFDRVELRLFPAEELRCAGLDIDAPPTSPFAPRTLAGFTGSAPFRNVSVGAPYTLVAWAQRPDNPVPLAAGCVELGSGVVLPGDLRFEVVVNDRQARLPDASPMRSRMSLTGAVAALGSSGVDRPWRTLACPVGPGQLVLDCTLDALAPDGALDCVVTSTAPIVATVEAARGPVNAAGCRPATVGAGASLDAELTAALDQGPFPDGTDLMDLVSTRGQLLTTIELDSRLDRINEAALGHFLLGATLRADGTDHVVDLLQTSRPVLMQAPVGYGVTGPVLSIGEHSFTLRLGSLLRDAFDDLGLGNAGLEARADDLGAALIESAGDATTSTTDCAAISAILCSSAGQANGCAQAACTSAAAYLDTAFSAWWRHLDGPDLDLTISGQATIYDVDDDLLVDGIGNNGSSTQLGLWSVTLHLADGSSAPGSGSFGSTSAVP